MTGREWERVRTTFSTASRELPGKYPREALLQLHRPILALLESAAIAGDLERRRQILEFLASRELQPDEIDCLVLLLRAAAADRRPRWPGALGLESLHERVKQALTAALNEPPRAAEDWSMRAPSQCKCKLCRRLASFLVARDRRRFDWPLAKDGRLHVHHTIGRHDLPVTHETRRSGRPFTLVLTKTRSLFERERAKRRKWTADLLWLEKQRHRFHSAPRGPGGSS
ncbi:MAG: hypothetical protein ACRD21_19245 [Vicinamibacteria bacterium]